jgi:hypothetical protein
MWCRSGDTQSIIAAREYRFFSFPTQNMKNIYSVEKLSFVTELNCRCYYFFLNNNNWKVLRNFRLVSLSHDFMNTPLNYALVKFLFYKYNPVVFFFTYTNILKIMNNDLLSQICLYYCVYTYIQCGHIWHRNKLSSCQMELLVSCSDDEH